MKEENILSLPPGCILLGNMIVSYELINEHFVLPLKPFCEMLGADYLAQYRALKAHPVLAAQVVETQILVWGRKTGPKPANSGSDLSGEARQTRDLVLPDGSAYHAQRRKVICLSGPTFLGWFMQLPTSDPDMATLKWRIYLALYEYMFSSPGRYRPFVERRLKLENERSELMQRLVENKDYQRLIEVEHELKKTRSAITSTRNKDLKKAEQEIAFPLLGEPSGN